MADEILKRDADRITVLGAVTDDANQYITQLRVDPATGRLKVSAIISTGGGITTLNGLTASTQDFVTVNDTNVTLSVSSSGGSHTFTMGWTSTLGLSRGGTNNSVTPSTGGVVYADGSKLVTLGTQSATGLILQSGSASAPAWSTATYPSTATVAGVVLQSDGTNWIRSTATYPATATTAGVHLRADGTNWVPSATSFPATAGAVGVYLRSDGTNWVPSTTTIPATAPAVGILLRSDGTNFVPTTATYPSTATTAGVILQADGANWIRSTATYPATATTTGVMLRSDGTNWMPTTATYPATAAINSILLAQGTNAISAVTAGTSSVLTTSSTGTMAFGTVSANLVVTTGNQLDTVQGIQTTSTPQFTRLGIGQAADSNTDIAVTGSIASKRGSDTFSTGTNTIDWSASNSHSLYLTNGTSTIAWSNAFDGQVIVVALTTGTVNCTVTWPATVSWSSGTAVTLSTGTSKTDVIAFYRHASNNKEYAQTIGQNYS